MVDKFSMKMVSACTKMHELSAEGITNVESIEKRREPMPAMEAIYLIGPSKDSVHCLMQDFSSQKRTTYKAVHVYFTEACLENRFIHICNFLAEDQNNEGNQHCHPVLHPGGVPLHQIQGGF